jgi:hypothetical protein
MLYLSIYVIGVLVGLAVMRDSWLPRTVTALLWPLGPIAFLVVVPILLVASAILWPLYVIPTAAVIGLVMWLM